MKTLVYIFCAFLLFKSNFAKGQQLKWYNTIGSSANDLIADIHIVNDSSIYLSGHSLNAIDLGSNDTSLIVGNSQSLGLAFLIKYNANKQIEWIYTIDAINSDDFINNICSDAAGNVYITGYVGGFFDAATNTDSTSLIGSDFGCAFLIKLDSNGNLIWSKSFISQKVPNIFAQAPWPIFVNGLKIINNGNDIYFSGIYQGITQLDPDSSLGNLNPISNNSIYNDIFICKYTTNGDFQWVFRLASQGTDAPSDLAFDNDGNLLISGLQGGALDFDPSSNTNYAPPIKGTSDCFMAKYSPLGNFIWAYVFGGTLGSDRVNTISSDENNNVYIAGEYRDTVDFAPTGVFNAISKGLKDAFIAKYSSNKTLQWVKSFGNENDSEGFKSLAYAEGKLYTTGSFANELLLNNTNLQALYSNGLNDALVAVFDTNGIAQRSFALGSKLADEGLIVVPNYNHVYVGGYYRDSTDFALDSALSLATCAGGYDIFVAEYNLDELVNKINYTISENVGVNLYPNPNNGNFSVNFTEQKISGVLEIYDLNGQLMHSEYVAPWSNTKQVNLQHKLGNGMYALRLSFGKQAGVVKFVVER